MEQSDKNQQQPLCNQKETAMGLFQEILILLKTFLVTFLASMWRFFVPPKRKSVNGEIVLITGSGSGIGRQIAIEFGILGAIVVLWDIDEERNFETAELVRQTGNKCFTYKCDVGKREEIYSVGRRVKAEVGDITILINNAGVVTGKKFIDCPDHLIERTFNINLLAYFWTVKCFLPSMIRKNHGHIVNIASSTGLVGLNKLTDYSTTKFGVVGFTEVLNYELVFSGYDGVNTTLVCPSFVKTGMFEGCEMRFPWVIPPLDKKKTVDRIMQAILTNQHMLCLPRLIYFFVCLKTILPVAAFREICRFFGAATFMDTYVGRDTKCNNTDAGINGSPTNEHNGSPMETNGKIKAC